MWMLSGAERLDILDSLILIPSLKAVLYQTVMRLKVRNWAVFCEFLGGLL
jgi:hypothetical protein